MIVREPLEALTMSMADSNALFAQSEPSIATRTLEYNSSAALWLIYLAQHEFGKPLVDRPILDKHAVTYYARDVRLAFQNYPEDVLVRDYANHLALFNNRQSADVFGLHSLEGVL